MGAGGFIIMKLLRDGWNRSGIVLLIIILILEFRVTTFLALRKESGRAEGIPHIVGNIEIRHRLNPALEELGGHIGYSVRPSERRKGYAVRMLRETLAFARGLGLERVMLDCDADNTGALKTILKCGGVFEKDTLCEYQGKANQEQALLDFSYIMC